jgi:hypothetical protein
MALSLSHIPHTRYDASNTCTLPLAGPSVLFLPCPFSYGILNLLIVFSSLVTHYPLIPCSIYIFLDFLVACFPLSARLVFPFGRGRGSRSQDGCGFGKLARSLWPERRDSVKIAGYLVSNITFPPMLDILHAHGVACAPFK